MSCCPILWWNPQPDNRSPVLDVALDLTRSKSELMIENALLRWQLAVLNRQVKRPKLTWRDRSSSSS
jgi:hypothetical protein